MIDRPRFRHSFVVHGAGPERVFLLNERRQIVLEGRAQALLAPLLDGRHTVDQVLAMLDGKAPVTDLLYALHHLTQKGYLVEGREDSGTGPAGEGAAAFWDTLEIDPRQAARRLAEESVDLQVLGQVDTGPLAEQLEGLGLRTERGGFPVVATDDALNGGLEALNRTMLANGRDWLLLRPVGVTPWIGPWFCPGRTACWECLANQQRAQRRSEGLVARLTGREVPLPLPRAGLPTANAATAALAATEIARRVVLGHAERLAGRVLTLGAIDLSWEEHALVRLPTCPACGEPPKHTAVQHALVLGDTATAEDPAEAFERLRHHISPLTGIVSSLHSSSTGDSPEPYHTSLARHPFPHPLHGIHELRSRRDQVSSGSGATAIQAQLSALCEALERHSGVWRGDEPQRKARPADLAPDAIAINDCLGFSERQFSERLAWNSEQPHDFHKVPHPLEASREICWSPLWSLTHETTRFLPAAYCYYGHPELQQFFCATDSNGTAAGPTLAQAVLRGAMELVERDSVALWWYNRVRRPAIDLDSFQSGSVRRIAATCKAVQREVWALDLSSDLEIPVVAAISRRVDAGTEDIVLGFGADFDPRAAVEAAFKEIGQALPSLVARGSDGRTRYPGGRPDAVHWWQTATTENQPYLLPDKTSEARRITDPGKSTGNAAADVQTFVERAREHDLEVLVLDQSRPEIGLPVARVVVPGLRHFWRRLGPGRLYNVPVKLGWLDRKHREDELNPISVFF